MKNVIPLVTAVLLGLAAVFAAHKAMKSVETPEEKKRQIVIVTGDISAGETIPESRVGVKWVPESAVPKNSIDAANIAFTYNQRAVHPIMKGDYILYQDLELDQSKSRALGDGQWGVSVKFADAALLKMLQPGDDIAIVGTFSYKEAVKVGKNADEARNEVTKTVTAVVYPRVSVLAVDGNTVLIALPPQQSIALTAIQRKAELYPILRKKKDENALNRLTGGKFEDSALAEMVKGLQPIEIPLVPTEVKASEVKD